MRLAAVCLAVLGAVNFYLCQGLFYAEYTGHTNSLQGLWISMARLAGEHWFRPSWWPYHDGGIPFEHSYMPLVPAASALIGWLAGVSPARAFHTFMGLVLCFGPLTLFVMAWRITKAPGAAFWATLAYSVTSTARALLPEGDLNPVRFWSSQRIYTSVVWDDLPHQTAVCFLPLAILFLWRACERRRPVWYVLAVVASVLTVLPSVFGATALAVSAACMLATLPRERLWANLRLLAALGAISYLIVSPFLPPSLLATIRSNQQRFVEDRWSLGSVAGLAIVAGGAALIVWLLGRRKAEPWVRFFAVFAFATSAIPLMDAWLNLHFLPQPNRYHFELEMGLALIAVPLVSRLGARLPRSIAIALALFVLCIAAEHIMGLRRFTAQITRPVDMSGLIEYRMAKWMEERFPGQRVMVSGSVAQWLNVFTDTPQLSGSSYSTTPNWTQQYAMNSLLTSTSPAELEKAVLWAKAFGVQAITSCGPHTPEFWKGQSSTRFDGLLPVLWRQEDTTIYGIPQRSPSLAHVVGEGDSAGDLKQYVAALDNPALPLADMRWLSLRSASIRTEAHRGQAVSVQINYHPGWHARANGRPVRASRDGFGFLLVEPGCDGPCVIELSYDGGWEYRICRRLSLFTMLALAGYALAAGVRSAVR
jgi:hypothetical protein